MASVSSRGRSPHSPYDFDSAPDTDESWQFIDYSSGGSNPASIGFLPSPASGSLNGYAIVGQVGASPAALSPLYLDIEQPAFSAATTLADHSDAFTATSAPTDAHFVPGATDSDQFMTPHQYMFTEQQLNDMTPFVNNLPLNSLGALQAQQQQLNLEIPQQPFPSESNFGPWNPTQLKTDASSLLGLENFSSPSPQSSSSGLATTPSPTSPMIKQEIDKLSPSPIRKVKGGKVEKKKAEQPSKFVIVTPTSINAHAGKPNPFECFEAMRTTQRGRKGPLANEIKENALQVRRLGACFCCHSRKVKCDKERPCKNCKKLMVHVPQIVCWQFQDFLTVLFPDFIRSHFKKDQMAKFMTENIDGFNIGGVEQTCAVELYSGASFSTVFSVRAKFFTPKSTEAIQHLHMQVGQDRVELQSRDAAPIGIELENNAQREELRKKAKEYIHAITTEPSYAEQVTDAFRHTELPKNVLSIIQKYANRTDSPIVKKALSIYASHYIMTRHLCLTRQTIINLSQTGLVPQDNPWLTPRVLNRQIKSVVDELLMRDMQNLFESFSKSLKPKSRREWAPCLAAFIVLCLFMEAVETAADTFVIAVNEQNIRNHMAPEYKREFALTINREVENLPFKQFAYQFHQIYQTHSKDASTKSFNPLMDDSFFEQGDVDGPAMEMVLKLRELIQHPNWSELDFLTMDPILPNEEDHPYPRDISMNYTGRLVAKFLLSFTDEKYIFGNSF